MSKASNEARADAAAAAVRLAEAWVAFWDAVEALSLPSVEQGGK